MIITCPKEPAAYQPRASSSYKYTYRDEVQRCKIQMVIYTVLLLVEIMCTLALVRFTLALYNLLQCRERMQHKVKLISISKRREVSQQPPTETETYIFWRTNTKLLLGKNKPKWTKLWMTKMSPFVFSIPQMMNLILIAVWHHKHVLKVILRRCFRLDRPLGGGDVTNL